MDAELEKAYREIFYDGLPATLSPKDHWRIELLEEIATGKTTVSGAKINLDHAIEEAEQNFPTSQYASKMRALKAMNEWYNSPNDEARKMALEIITEEGIESIANFFPDCVDTLKIYRIADIKRDFDSVLRLTEELDKEEDKAELVLLQAREIVKSKCPEAIDYMLTKMPGYAKNYKLGPGDKIIMKETVKKEEYAAA